MINWIWAGMIVAGSVQLILTGHADRISTGLLNGGKEAVTLVIGLCGTITFWTGLMKIAEQSGCLTFFRKLSAPVLRVIFPKLHRDHPAFGWIASNVAANLLGLGNAATPLGIRAMQVMQADAPESHTATREMRTFVILNTAGVTLIPSTVIGLRHVYGAVQPDAIIVPSVLVTLIALLVALMIDRFLQKRT